MNYCQWDTVSDYELLYINGGGTLAKIGGVFQMVGGVGSMVCGAILVAIPEPTMSTVIAGAALCSSGFTSFASGLSALA